MDARQAVTSHIPVGLDPEALEQLHVVSCAVVVVSRNVSSVRVVHHPADVTEQVPYARAPPVLIDRPLNLHMHT